MRIKGTCKRCEREFLAQQVADSGGRCPWCGQPFTRDYTSLLATSLREAEAAGTFLSQALEQVAETDPAMELDEESIVGDIRDAIRVLRRRRSRV